jgi:hypothetical protein
MIINIFKFIKFMILITCDRNVTSFVQLFVPFDMTNKLKVISKLKKIPISFLVVSLS